MKTIALALSMNTAHSLGWTLFHFVWEGSAIALLLAIAQFFLPVRAAKARYAAGCIALAAMALAPALTFLALDRTAGGPSWTAVAGPVAQLFSGPTQPSRLGGADGSGMTGWGLEAVMPWLACLWLGGVVLMALRLGAGWRRVRRIWTTQITAMDPLWMERLEELKGRLGVTRPVRLFQSALVEAPGVFGWLRPVILIPVSVLSGLTPAQLESILAHELAHIRRHDYLVNLAQNLIETVLFYHPAVWWVSRRVREERENCCDDLAVEACGSVETYARALASLEEIRSLPDTLALAADGGPLLARIHRLLHPGAAKPAAGSKRRRVFWGAVLAIVTGVTLWTCELSGATFGISFPFHSLSRATARIALVPEREGAGGTDRPGDGGLASGQSIRLEAERIRSRSVLYSMINDLKLTTKWGARDHRERDLSEEEVYLKLLGRIQISVVPDTRILSITVRSEDPKEAAAIANSIVDQYRSSRDRTRGDRTMYRMRYFQTALESCERDIHELNIAGNNDPDKIGAWRINDRLDFLKSQREAWQKTIQQEEIRAHLESSNEFEVLDRAVAER